ncbi:MAG: hypothetical protein AAFQ84_03665 [Pseudomonadota bacterium]
MTIIRHLNLAAMSREALRGLLCAAFVAAAHAAPGSPDHDEAKRLVAAIKYELAVRDHVR